MLVVADDTTSQTGLGAMCAEPCYTRRMTESWDVAFARPSQAKSPSDDEIEVSGCIVCMEPAVAIAFHHRHVEDRRVAVPARVGLCSACVELIRAQQFMALTRRAHAETWEDFDESDFLDTARDLARDLASHRAES